MAGVVATCREDLLVRDGESAFDVLHCFGAVILPGRDDYFGRVVPAASKQLAIKAPPWQWESIANGEKNDVHGGDDNKRLHWPRDKHLSDWPARPRVCRAIDKELEDAGLAQCDPKTEYGLRGMVKTATDVRALKSLAGCREQPAHADGRAGILRYGEWRNGTHGGAPLMNGDMPLSVLVADERGSRYIMYPRACSGPRSKIDLEGDDMLVTRYDLVHAGAQYDEENMRFHAYDDSPA